MIKKKKIAGIASASVMALILCIGTTSVFASNNDGLKKNAAAKAQTSKPVVKVVQTHDDLVAIATEFGISTAGMSDEQIEAALVAYKQSHQENAKLDGLSPHDHLIAVAAEVGIKTADMTDKQIEEALVAYKMSPQNEAVKTTDLQGIAKKMGIDTNGKSDEQIKAAISEKGKTLEKEPTRAELEAAAKTMGIDSTGMTDKQLGVAIKTAKVNLKK